MHRIRKFIASTLAFAVLAGTAGATAAIPGSDTPFGITVSAAETTANDFTWNLDSNGVLTITGTGEMPSYDWSKSSFTKSQVKKVIISEGVTSIVEEAFLECDSLKSVIIPGSVTSIGDWAFSTCSSLEHITITGGVTSIGKGAFTYCFSLKIITIPDGVTQIHDYTFCHCPSLTSITIPDSVTSIGNHAFKDCYHLTSVTIPDTVMSIGEQALGYYYDDDSYETKKTAGFTIKGYNGTEAERYANENGFEFISLDETKITESGKCGENVFYTLDSEGTLIITGTGEMYDYEKYDGSPFHHNWGIKQIIIEDSVTSIGKYAFEDCYYLTRVTIPDSVTSIGFGAFMECTYLTSITIPDSVISIGDGAFCMCAFLTKIIIPDSVKSIGNGVFNECDFLTSITIPDSVTSIEDYAFRKCTSLTSITIPDSVTSIGDHAFEDCYHLTSVTIPDTVTNIGYQALGYYYSNSNTIVKQTDFTIKGYPGSEAECYANDNGFKFIPLEGYDEYSSLDKELVKKTKLYTSDGGIVYRKVLESLNENLSRDDISREDKIAMLNNFYKLFNITEVQEGTAYCLEEMNGKKAYDYLTNDEIFLSYQFKNYLQNTEKGTIARGLMITDGWIFNNELKQWIDPKTYITQETVDIKNYKAMLLSFMYYEAETGAAGDVSEIVGYADKVRTHIEYLAENLDEAAKKNIKKDLADVRKNYNTMTSEQVRQEMQRIWNKYQLTDTIENGKITYHVKGFDELSKALQISGNVFQITVTSIDDIMDIVNVENKLETIEKYRKFLELVANGKDYLPGDLVIAANQLLNETIMPYFKQFVAFIYDEAVCVDGIFDVSKSLKKQLSEKLTSKYPKLFEGKLAGFASTFGDAVAVIKISAVVTNAITNIGTTIKDAAYVEAYAYLGEYFSDILRNKKDQFNTDQSAENAWEFYDIYNLLFRIRACGENSYLKMCDDSPVTWILSGVGFNYFDIKDRKKYVEGTFDYMNNYCFFGLENADQIPESHKFAQKAVIKCPVNVEIYDLSGNLVYTIFDGKEIDETNEIGRFISTYDPKLGEYIKIVYLENRDNYTVKNVGVDFGNVSIETAVVNSDDTVTTAKVSGLPIEEYGIITVDMQTNQYTDDQNGDGNVEYTGVLQNTETSEVVNVTGIELSANTLKLNAGEKTALGVMISPDNATFTDVIWSSDNEDVAMVNNGAVTAISAGTATITAMTSNGITATCTVTVVELTGGVIGDVNGDGSADIADSLFIARADAGLATLSDAQKKSADVNGDGSADIADALFIARVDAGLAKL